MTTYIFWYLVLVQPKPAHPVYVQRFADPVDCQVQVIERRDLEPKNRYECRRLTSLVDLGKPVGAKQ